MSEERKDEMISASVIFFVMGLIMLVRRLNGYPDPPWSVVAVPFLAPFAFIVFTLILKFCLKYFNK